MFDASAAEPAMKAPICKHHNCHMVGERKRVPFMGQHKRFMRTEYHCPVKGCHFVATGEEELTHTPYQRRAERNGWAYLSNL